MPNTKFKPILLICILFFLLIFLSAFANQPATSTEATSTPTATSTYEIPRWDPQVTPLPITTPDAPMDQYTLVDWNADTAYSALAGLRQHKIDYINEFDAYQMLLVESYIRFPEQFTDPDLFQELAYEAKFNSHSGTPAVLTDIFPPVSLYGQILTDALNNGEIQIDEMPEWISANMAVEIKDSAVVENLINKGSRSWVYSLRKFFWHKDFIITQQADGTFISTSFPNQGYEQWRDYEYNFDIVDINGNGIPEIVEINFFPNYYEYEDTFVQLSVYEWDGS